MKPHHLFLVVLFFIYFTIACYPDNGPEEVPEDVDLEKLREQTSGTLSEVTTQGTGVFFAYNQNCTAGFGICDLKPEQPNPPGGTSAEPRRPGFKRYTATFYLGTEKDTTFLRIEFNEEIPNYASVFNDGYPDTLGNAFGYEYIILVTGNYSPEKKTNPFGSVKMPVKTGKRSSAYQ